jgi:hypothetical protein
MEKKKEKRKLKLENLQKNPILSYVSSVDQFSVGPMSEIVFSRLKTRISAHCNEFSQNRWFFTISRNSGGFAYFPHKCGGFLELTLAPQRRHGSQTLAFSSSDV